MVDRNPLYSLLERYLNARVAKGAPSPSKYAVLNVSAEVVLSMSPSLAKNQPSTIGS